MTGKKKKKKRVCREKEINARSLVKKDGTFIAT